MIVLHFSNNLAHRQLISHSFVIFAIQKPYYEENQEWGINSSIVFTFCQISSAELVGEIIMGIAVKCFCNIHLHTMKRVFKFQRHFLSRQRKATLQHVSYKHNYRFLVNTNKFNWLDLAVTTLSRLNRNSHGELLRFTFST